ncbi:MAG: hypothetical protein K1X92_14825 [Bacteroidia bacterium]|nr:hypothetical protein [Bacteroidia bacterium]
MIKFTPTSPLNVELLENMLKSQFQSPEYTVVKPGFTLFGEYVWVKNGPVSATVVVRKNGEIRVRGQVNYQHTPILIAMVVGILLIRLVLFITLIVCHFKYKEQYKALEQEVADYIQADFSIDEIGKTETVNWEP